MSWTKVGFPSSFAAEGNPVAGGFPGEFDPFVHTTNDKIDVDPSTGVFSFEVSPLQSQSTIAGPLLTTVVTRFTAHGEIFRVGHRFCC